MNWLVFVFSLEMGFIPNGAFLMYEREPVVFSYDDAYWITTVEMEDFGNSFYTDFQIEAIFLDYMFVGGGVRVTMLSTNDYTFSPQSSYYNFSFGARFSILEVFWHHYCMHPQMTYMYDYVPVNGWEDAYNEIGIKIEGKINLIGGKK